MQRRKTLSDLGIAALKPRTARYAYPDPEMRGHYVRVQPSAAKSFVTVARNPLGKQVWTTIGATDVLKIAEARAKARAIIGRVRAGLPGLEAPPVKPDTLAAVAAVAATWLKRHVEAKRLRSRREIERLLARHVLPTWGEREFISLRRSDIATLLDRVQNRHGARQADYVLAIVRGIANWYASRHDDYVSPFTRGMRRTDPKTRTRDRTLSDDELRAVWTATAAGGRFAAIVRLALLTAQRREKIANMRWGDVSLDGTWSVPAEEREKGTAGALALPPAAFALIQAQPHLGDNSFVFAGSGQGAFSGFSKAKRELNAQLPPMPPWVLHDLRRTARSLMARAGVRPDIAERVLGHVIAGVEGIYDRHRYDDEKADALKRLAALIDDIVTPRENIVTFTKSRKQRK